MTSKLRSAMIRLAHEKPELRSALLPLLSKTAALVLLKNEYKGKTTWSFRGNVPTELHWERKDGKPISQEDLHDAAHSNAPALMGFKTRVFSSKAEAEAAAKKLNVRITQSDEE